MKLSPVTRCPEDVEVRKLETQHALNVMCKGGCCVGYVTIEQSVDEWAIKGAEKELCASNKSARLFLSCFSPMFERTAILVILQLKT